MKFKILAAGTRIPQDKKDIVYLITDNWDDWFEFSTLYILVFVDSWGTNHRIGSVKIGQFGMVKGQRRPELPEYFEKLNEQFFSVGQDDSYYENLNNIGIDNRENILDTLFDIAANNELYKRAIKERVTKISLLRSVSTTSIKGQFRRLAKGDIRLSKYAFSYRAPKFKNSDQAPMDLKFNVEPESNPPTNIHVLIGRNGVGKTHLINNMINSLLDEEAIPSKVGRFIAHDEANGDIFSNIVSVTFSAFDETEPLPERKDKSFGMQYSYVGLKRTKKSNDRNLPPKSPTMLKNEFVKSIELCRVGSKFKRWNRAIRMLEADPIFKESNIISIADIEDENEFKTYAGNIFKKLSSGHKIVLLTITRLVETVEEKSLILLDEPEAHLHPPLLSAFIRSLSDLLIQRNGVAIIATHSPVVLQEVPMSCVWKLRRSGEIAKAERLETESFGENVGILTSEVFSLELTNSGFHKLLANAVNDYSTYDVAYNSMDGQLGIEAQAVLRALYYIKESNSEDQR